MSLHKPPSPYALPLIIQTLPVKRLSCRRRRRHGPAQRSDRVHSAEQESAEQGQYSAGASPDDFSFYDRIHLKDPSVQSHDSWLILVALALHALDVLAITIDLGLVAVNLLLLLVIGDFMTLQLIADQRAGA